MRRDWHNLRSMILELEAAGSITVTAYDYDRDRKMAALATAIKMQLIDGDAEFGRAKCLTKEGLEFAAHIRSESVWRAVMDRLWAVDQDLPLELLQELLREEIGLRVRGDKRRQRIGFHKEPCDEV